MGFNKTSGSIPIKIITQSGVGGFWWVEKDGLGDASQLGYRLNGSVQSAGDLFGAASFKNLLDKMVTDSIALKDFDTPINIDDILVINGIENQITNLNQAELDQIELDWNINKLIKRWANPLLGIAFLKINTITWPGLQSRFTEMGERGKFLRGRLVELLDQMVIDGDITQGQANTYLNLWDNNPNISA